MNRSHSGVRSGATTVATFALVVGMVWTTACATDAAGPSVELMPGVTSSLLQDENLVPNNDASNPGNLEPFGSLWASLDEDIPNDDTDYIWRYRTGQPPTNSAATVDLTSPVGGTPSASQSHKLRVRWKVVGDYSTSTPQPTLLNFKVVDQTNGVIGSGTSIPTGSNYITDSAVVDPSLITDYATLQIYLNVQLKPAFSSNQIQARITWARLEIR